MLLIVAWFPVKGNSLDTGSGGIVEKNVLLLQIKEYSGIFFYL